MSAIGSPGEDYFYFLPGPGEQAGGGLPTVRSRASLELQERESNNADLGGGGVEKSRSPAGDRTPKILAGLAIFGLVLVFGGLFLPKIINSLHPLGNRTWEEMGQRGDLYGGFLNPLLSFLAFMGVLYSIYLQRIDLRESQQETQRQQFEATFFQLMAQHNRIVEGIDIRSREHAQISGGRDCFRHFLYSLQGSIAGCQNVRGQSERDRIKSGYKEFWQESRQDLGHYYRFLYNFIRYVHEANLPRLPYDQVDPKIKYVRIIRAQLSDYELALAFYNSLGDHGGKFKAFVATYDLLDNLPTDIIKPQEHLDYRDGMGQVGKLPKL